MQCIYYLFYKCRRKKEKKYKVNEVNLKKNLEQIKMYGTSIKKRSNSFPMHPTCDFIFKNYEYEKEEIKLFADRAIKHHNHTKNREKQQRQN